ncbi:MAG: arginine/lysine/histidine transport system ATP-binding protein [Frankiaceae bacterium]|jgi:putative ABC transport system ATP-binding protein|nr:arginine/lysine/histidine transport system ATP-binding protein [Frankiaceae bacterium]
MPSAALFEVADVATTRGSGDGHVHPIEHVDAAIPAGGISVIVGPSGAGKSTFLRLLNRMEEPTWGTVTFRGRKLPEYDVLALRREVGLLLQVPTPFPGTVADNIRTGAPALADAAAAELLDRVGLDPALLRRDALSLSGGEAQRMCLARALALQPAVLLLDEPTSALDPFSTAAVEDVVVRLVEDGVSAVWVCHDLQLARRVATFALVLDGGSVVEQGPAAEVFANPADERARRFLLDPR